MRDAIWIVNDQGEDELLYLDDIDPEVLPQLLQPVGGFCCSASSFMMLPLTVAPFYVKDWLPKQGRVMFYGPAKGGKSLLALQLARCIGAGEPFVNIPTNWGKVLYLQFEIGLPALKKRMVDTGQEYQNVYVGTTFDMKLDTKQGQEKMRIAIAEVKPDVVICDPWYKMMLGDPDKVHEASVVTNFQDEVIVSDGCSFVNMHHIGKDPSQGPRNTSHLLDWHDSLIELKRVSKRGEPLRIKLTPQRLRHAEAGPNPIEAELIDFEFQQIDAPLTIFQKVRDYLEKHKRLTPKDLIGAGIGSETSRAPIHEALSRLTRLGLAEKVERGVYQWK